MALNVVRAGDLRVRMVQARLPRSLLRWPAARPANGLLWRTVPWSPRRSSRTPRERPFTSIGHLTGLVQLKKNAAEALPTAGALDGFGGTRTSGPLAQPRRAFGPPAMSLDSHPVEYLRELLTSGGAITVAEHMRTEDGTRVLLRTPLATRTGAGGPFEPSNRQLGPAARCVPRPLLCDGRAPAVVHIVQAIR